MSALGLLNLRALKYQGTEQSWDGVLEHLGVPRLERQEALDQIIEGMSEYPETRTTLTALELLYDHPRLELEDSIGRLADLVVTEPKHSSKLVKMVRRESFQRLSFTQFVEELKKQDLVASHVQTADIPSCDAALTPGGGRGAARVLGRFQMQGKLEDFEYATDPRNWPSCSWFFISMISQDRHADFSPSQPDEGYTDVYEETVGIPGVLTIRTPLAVRYFVGAQSLGMEFDLAAGFEGDGKIDVDHGFLLVEKHPSVADTVTVTSQKTLSFVGLDDLPFTFLCEFGWIDMMRAMAHCREGG